MNNKEQLEITRNILNNTIKTNRSTDIILKLSQKMDKHIVDYYKNLAEKDSSSVVKSK